MTELNSTENVGRLNNFLMLCVKELLNSLSHSAKIEFNGNYKVCVV